MGFASATQLVTPPNKLAAKGAKASSCKNLNNIQTLTPRASLMSHLHFRESNKHWNHVRFMNEHMQDKKKKREGWKIMEGEPDSVSTATLIDILQVEQLSSGLTTAS